MGVPPPKGERNLSPQPIRKCGERAARTFSEPCKHGLLNQRARFCTTSISDGYLAKLGEDAIPPRWRGGRRRSRRVGWAFSVFHRRLRPRRPPDAHPTQPPRQREGDLRRDLFL